MKMRPTWAALPLLLYACGGAQTTGTETPAEATSPVYTTSGTPEGQHTMPDGTTMSGHEHMEHGPGQHTMADGGVMPGDHHPGGETHVMPDGTVMPGAQHGAHE